MRKAALLLVMAFLLTLPAVLAKNITLSLPSNESYFLVGEDATLIMETNNTYGKRIDGTLTYTITQEINQPNIQKLNTNSQSMPFSIEDNENSMSLSFGTSDTPLELLVSFVFSYYEKESMEVRLDDIIIHFVADESQKQQTGQCISSSSQQTAQQQQQNQQMQQLIDQILGNEQQSLTEQEQRLQNNQMAQDSSAMKEQMQRQLEEDQQMRDEFQKQLTENPEFQQAHQEMTDKGYKPTSGSIEPTGNASGTFDLSYQDSEGREGKISGEMMDGEMERLATRTDAEMDELMEALQVDPRFQEYQEQLSDEGYEQSATEFTDDMAQAQLSYTGPENQSATITAEFVNETVESVELEKEDDRQHSFWPWFIAALLLTGLGYAVYRIRSRKPSLEPEPVIVPEEPFDHLATAKRILRQAQRLHRSGRKKDAFGRAAQALRLYLAWENGLEKEITNEDLLLFLAESGEDNTQIHRCLELCSLVEFAKLHPAHRNFRDVVSTVKIQLK